jgi:hypothetical protein
MRRTDNLTTFISRLSGNLGAAASCPRLYRQCFTFTNYAVREEATMTNCVNPQYRDVEVLTEASFRSNDSHTGGQRVKLPNDRCFLLRYILVFTKVSRVDRFILFRDINRYAPFLITELYIQHVVCC